MRDSEHDDGEESRDRPAACVSVMLVSIVLVLEPQTKRPVTVNEMARHEETVSLRRKFWCCDFLVELGPLCIAWSTTAHVRASSFAPAPMVR